MASVLSRRERTVRLTAGLLALLGAFAVGVANAELKNAAPKGVNLTAIWKINAEQSDDPYKTVAKKRDTDANSGGWGGPPPPASSGGVDAGDIFGGGTVSGTLGGGRGTVGGTYGGGTYGRGRRTGSPNSPSSSSDSDPTTDTASNGRMPLDSFLSTREQFEIEQQPDALTFRTVEDSSTCKPGVTDQVPIQGGEKVNRHCGWNGSTFVVELVSDDGTTRVNRYELRNKDKQLVMTSEVKGGKGQFRGLKIRRVYDRMISAF